MKKQVTYSRWCPRCFARTPHTVSWRRPFYGTCRAAEARQGIIRVCEHTHPIIGQELSALVFGGLALLYTAWCVKLVNPPRKQWVLHRARVAVAFLNTLDARLAAAGVPRCRRRQIMRDMLYRHDIGTLKQLGREE